MKATLCLGHDSDTRRLHYAASTLLDLMRLDLPLETKNDATSSNSGLVLPGGLLVSEEKLQAVFDVLTLQHEARTGRLDGRGMLDDQAITWDVSRPWIDAEAQALVRQLTATGLPLTPRSRRFKVVITHDIDRTFLLEPTSIASAVMRMVGLRRSHCVRLWTVLSPGILLATIQRLLEFEVAHQIGAYYFMLSGPYSMRRYGSRCDIRWRYSRMIAEMVSRAGMTIGLHGSYYARDENSYRQEKERLKEVLGQAITSHRNHYLRFDPLRMWGQLEQAGIAYDFSVGFNNRFGFRSGCASLYRTFDLASNRTTTVQSVPLLYMDNVLFQSNPKRMLCQLRAALQEVQKVNGCVSLLFHPDCFLIDETFWEFFEELVEMCEELGADLSGKLP